MNETIDNPYDAGSIADYSLHSRRITVRFWIACALMLCGYAAVAFIKISATNPYYPISEESGFCLILALFAASMLTDRRLIASEATRFQWIVTGAIYLFAYHVSNYAFGVNYLESSKIPWLTIAMASIHLFNAIAESCGGDESRAVNRLE